MPKTAYRDIIGKAGLCGYRAPYFSIANRDNLYVLEMLADAGLMYDSSIVPMKLAALWYLLTLRMMSDKLYKLPSGTDIVELPITVAHFARRRWPVAGGEVTYA